MFVDTHARRRKAESQPHATGGPCSSADGAQYYADRPPPIDAMCVRVYDENDRDLGRKSLTFLLSKERQSQIIINSSNVGFRLSGQEASRRLIHPIIDGPCLVRSRSSPQRKMQVIQFSRSKKKSMLTTFSTSILILWLHLLRSPPCVTRPQSTPV